ncbi:hypothetical protein E6W39_02365 [Kitasatospora acidiphila]|uniref:Uncharacterized protein n=1 Tax=Kitasatospora acidiphila TaxID=2567942 RepID=A0A540VWZ5_9ACTN|nr:hypothetical protein [Kitasatospora acidiphila]TQF01289.1 hypothetical protein E6W39_02365 [Kitasatospora acidiphila]
MAKQPRDKQPADRIADRRAKAAAARQAELKAERRRRLLVRSAVGALALAVLGGVGAAVASQSSGSHGSTAAAMPAHPRTTADGRTSAAPWNAPADASAAVAAAGLPMLSSEGTAEHIHTHLDVYVDGKQVTVPALLGIDESAQQISPLHTHDTSGVIHIESPVQTDFTLGQFMTEWQVSMSADHIGGSTTDQTHALTAYVNGKAVSGDPAAIVLHAHDEIALVYGTAAENSQVNVPNSYAFAAGL